MRIKKINSFLSNTSSGRSALKKFSGRHPFGRPGPTRNEVTRARRTGRFGIDSLL